MKVNDGLLVNYWKSMENGFGIVWEPWFFSSRLHGQKGII